MALLSVLALASVIRGRPMQPNLEPIDICLFTCEYCYQGEVLVTCANECLIQDGIMRREWLKTCPYFGQPLYFE